MKKLSMLCALAVLASSVWAFENGSQFEFMLQSGNSSWISSGRVLDPVALRAKYGDHFAATVRDGRVYVVTNPAVLDRLERLEAPINELGRRQAVLGSKQAELGSEQARIGQEQAIIGAKQAAISVADNREASSDLSEQQRRLGEKQRVLGEQQRRLGEQQRVLGDQQRDLSRQTMPKVERVFDDAIVTGAAVRQ